jgi:putative FmdB family regulatory protein|tara:strand:- start:8371 stop:8670 length:300 start_codon:yes stop_codon:yes gene_type:complete
MPIYEYLCGNCQFRLEKIQKFSDSPLLDCPACDNPALKKLISAAAFRLKGGGWYETDFKTGAKKNVSASSDSSSDSSSGSSSGSSGGESSSGSSSSSAD